jgi:A/G-specific adenine glycosylase
LANASLQDVLHIWEGLGYYTELAICTAAARMIVERSWGHFPSDREGLARLPGVGRYTAGAIASIAFGQDEPALDGNIRRVFSRVFDLRIPARRQEGERLSMEFAADHLPSGQAGDYNQA